MEPALHGEYLLGAEFAEYEFPAVSFYGGDGEVGDVLVGYFFFDVDMVYQFSESCAEYDGGLGHYGVFFFEECGCFFNFF